MPIAENIDIIRKNIERIASGHISLVAATKGHTVEEIEEAIRGGITVIGENRWQEAKEKIPFLEGRVQKHFIGHLQSNKVSWVVHSFDMIQSIDTFALAKKVDQACEKIGRVMPILIEVKTSEEARKHGVMMERCAELIESASKLKWIEVQGLMTLATHSDNKKKVRSCFRSLKKLFDTIQKKHIPHVDIRYLSMGMTDDYPIALEEGANMVRIGRGIFA